MVFTPAAGGGRRHRLGIGERQRQRLLAMHVLARGDGGERHLAVKPVGGGDADDVDGRVGHQRPPVTGRAGEAELVGEGGRLVARDVAEQFQPHVGQIAEHRPGVAVGERMALAHEAGADQADAQCVHSRPPPLRSPARLRSPCPARRDPDACDNGIFVPKWNCPVRAPESREFE
jgi:hypothetical protein